MAKQTHSPIRRETIVIRVDDDVEDLNDRIQFNEQAGFYQFGQIKMIPYSDEDQKGPPKVLYLVTMVKEWVL